MATTGQINTNITYDSYFWVYWKQEGEQDIANNKTKIYWSCGVICGHSFYSNAIKMSAVSINGVQVYAGGTYSNFSKGEHRIAYGYLDIPHAADGTKTFNISSFTGWLYSSYNYSSSGGSYELPSIPRQATITGAPDFTDLQNPTITYSNPAGNAVTELKACISFTGAYADIDYRDISKTGSTYTFNLTAAERDVLRNNTPGPDRTVIFFVRSTIGNAVYHSTLMKTLYMEESAATKPTLSMTLSPVSTLSEPFKSLYIQGKSKVKASLQMSAKSGANIVASSINVEGTDYGDPYESAVLSQPGTHVINAAVRDSRGFYGTCIQEIPVISYSKPSVESEYCYRSDGNGKKTNNSTSLWIKAKRSYSPVEGKNTCALQWRWKKAAEAWNDKLWSDLLNRNTAGNEYNALIPGLVFDLKEAYTVQIRAIDEIGEYDIKTIDVPTEDVALHLGKGGKNVSVGSYCDYSEEYTFHSEWKAIFDKEVIINGLPVANHVVEEGTYGIWTYRKWLDGSAECCGISVQENVAVETAWGNLFESAGFVFDLPSGLFVETPQFNITMVGSRGIILEVYSEGSTTQTPHVCAVRPHADTIETLNTSIVAHGRWK